MLMLIFIVDEYHSHRVHSKSVAKQAIGTSVPLWRPSLLNVWGSCVCIWLIWSTCKKMQVTTGADLVEPRPNKFGDLSVFEHTKIHTQMPPEGHTCKGGESNPLYKTDPLFVGTRRASRAWVCSLGDTQLKIVLFLSRSRSWVLLVLLLATHVKALASCFVCALFR